MKKLSKIQLIDLCLALALAAVVILNICLLTTDIYCGTYVYKNGSEKVEITFSDNTYVRSYYGEEIQFNRYSGGFYKYIPKYEIKDSIIYDDLKKDNIIITGSSVLGEGIYEKNSVFSISDCFVDEKSEKTYICNEAVFLQVLYGILIIFFVAALIIINILYFKRKNRQSKVAKENTDMQTGRQN